MQTNHYRLNSDTLAISEVYPRPITVIIPEGSTIVVVEAQVGSRLVDVIWEDQIFKIFGQDLDERGILEEAIAPADQVERKSKSQAG